MVTPNAEGNALSRTITCLFQNTAFRLALILLLGILAYSNTFNVPFVWDDKINIAENPLIKDFSYFIEPSKAEDIKAHYNPAVVNIFKTRYIGYLTFALNYHFHGLDVKGYHIVNLAVHIVNALLVYWLVVLTFRTPYMKESPLGTHAAKIALFSALLFVAHPIQTQAVTYIVQRFASLATLFYLLSLTMYIRCRLRGTLDSRSIALYVLAFISAVMAMNTKEIAFTLPLVAALYEFFFFRDALKRKMLYLVPLLLTVLIIPMSILNTDRPLGEMLGNVGEAVRLQTDISRLDYLFTQFRVITTYIRLLFLPINQNLDYDYPVYGSFFNPQVFLSFLLLVSILGLGAFLFWRSRTSGPALRVISFGIFWFFITLSVESSFIPIRDVIFEHRLYLPSVGVVMATATGAAIALQRLKGSRLIAAATALIVIAPFVLTAAAYKRNAVWQSETSLWEDVVRKAPGNVRGHYNTGVAYGDRGLRDKAIERYRAAIRLKPLSGKPSITEAHNALGNIYAAQGLHKKAIEHFRTAIALAPGYAPSYNNLGNAYAAQDLHKKAIKHFRTAIKLRPSFVEAHYNLGSLYGSIGQLEKAEEHLRAAIKFQPDYPHAHNNLGNVYFLHGKYDEAIKHFQFAIKSSQENYYEAHYNLGLAYREKGLEDKAQEHFRIAENLRQKSR